MNKNYVYIKTTISILTCISIVFIISHFIKLKKIHKIIKKQTYSHLSLSKKSNFNSNLNNTNLDDMPGTISYSSKEGASPRLNYNNLSSEEKLISFITKSFNRPEGSTFTNHDLSEIRKFSSIPNKKSIVLNQYESGKFDSNPIFKISLLEFAIDSLYPLDNSIAGLALNEVLLRSSEYTRNNDEINNDNPLSNNNHSLSNPVLESQLAFKIFITTCEEYAYCLNGTLRTLSNHKNYAVIDYAAQLFINRFQVREELIHNLNINKIYIKGYNSLENDQPVEQQDQ